MLQLKQICIIKTFLIPQRFKRIICLKCVNLIPASKYLNKYKRISQFRWQSQTQLEDRPHLNETRNFNLQRGYQIPLKCTSSPCKLFCPCPFAVVRFESLSNMKLLHECFWYTWKEYLLYSGWVHRAYCWVII